MGVVAVEVVGVVGCGLLLRKSSTKGLSAQ